MAHVRRLLLGGGRARRDAAGAAGIADVIDGDVIDYRRVVDVGDMNVGNIIDAAVVIELVATPVTALIAMTGVAVAVVHTAVEADLRPPEAGIPEIEPIPPAPIARCPQKSHLGRLNPSPGYPEIPVRTVGPVSRGPDIAWRRNRRLYVHG